MYDLFIQVMALGLQAVLIQGQAFMDCRSNFVSTLLLFFGQVRLPGVSRILTFGVFSFSVEGFECPELA